jgi:hypothetical protein
MLLTDLFTELISKLNGTAPSDETVAAIEQLVVDDDVEDERVPGWFIEALKAVLAGEEKATVWFPSIGSDVRSFVAEVSPLIPGMDLEDEGEYLLMKFPSLGLEIYMSGEAIDPATGKGCDSIAVQRL